jgi:diketogulonate reductase-like aldo/keto reductase
VALRFLARRPSVFVIPKSSSTTHMTDNAAADALRLDDAEVARIAVAFPLGSRRRGVPML